MKGQMRLTYEQIDGSLVTVETQCEKLGSGSVTSTVMFRVTRQLEADVKALQDCLKQRDQEQAGILASAERVESTNRELRRELANIVRVLGYGEEGLAVEEIAPKIRDLRDKATPPERLGNA